MSKIVIGQQLIVDPSVPWEKTQHLGAQVGFDVPLLLGGRLLITADSGGGKSFLVRVLFEQAFGKVQSIIIDPEGEFASLREKFPFVLAGKGGDTPIDIRSAGMLAHRLLKLRVSAICDLYELKADQRHIWVREFFNALIEAPKELRVPLVVGVDEFHIFAPEKGQGESEALQASVDIATRGRKRGICLAGITQRLAMLNKNVTSQLQNRLVGAQFEEVNVKVALKLFGITPGAEERQFRHQLQLLEPGQFFAFGRAISRERILVKVRDVQTTHPKAFEKHNVPLPPTPEKIKGLLPQLADLPKEAEARALTEAEYKKQIRELTAEKNRISVELARASQSAQKNSQDTTAAIANSQAVKQLRTALEDAMRVIAKVTAFGFEETKVNTQQVEAAVKKALEEVGRQISLAHALRRKEFDKLKADLDALLARTEKLLDKKLEVNVDVVRADPPFVLGPSSAPKAVTLKGPAAPYNPELELKGAGVRSLAKQIDRDIVGAAVPLGSVARQIAGILAAYHPEPMKRSILAAMCGLVDGGNFSNRLSECRVAGLIDDPGRGLVRATDEGVRQFAGTFRAPTTTEEVLALWAPKLGSLAQQIIRKLVEAGGEPVRRGELAESLGLVDGGNFSNRLSEVRVAGLLVDPGRGLVAANREALFLDRSQAASA